jgi:hypothetical protein
MFIQVASYRLGSGSTADLVRRVEEGNIPVIREVPGFRGYYALDAGDGVVASVILYDDKSGAEEAENRLADWIEKTMEEFQVTPLDVLDGEVIASSE